MPNSPQHREVTVEIKKPVEINSKRPEDSNITPSDAILAPYHRTMEEAITAMNTNLADFKNIKIIKVQSNSLPFKDSSIDMVFAANSFHDVPVGYESEIRRVLNTNGLFVNLDWKKEPTTFGPPLSIRFSEDDVVSKLKKQHFKLIKKQDIKTHYMLIFSKI